MRKNHEDIKYKGCFSIWHKICTINMGFMTINKILKILIYPCLIHLNYYLYWFLGETQIARQVIIWRLDAQQWKYPKPNMTL